MRMFFPLCAPLCVKSMIYYLLSFGFSVVSELTSVYFDLVSFGAFFGAVFFPDSPVFLISFQSESQSGTLSVDENSKVSTNRNLRVTKIIAIAQTGICVSRR